MKVLKDSVEGPFDLSIVGLGYEQRASKRFNLERATLGKVLVLGYLKHNKVPQYEANKTNYLSHDATLYEGDDSGVQAQLIQWLTSNSSANAEPMKVLVDITVFSRSRLSALLYILIKTLPKGSLLTISYEISQFVEPTAGLSPIKTVGEVIPELSGAIGDLTKPTSLILGLGYEEGKALGLANYIDSEINFAFLPTGIDQRFDELVVKNNQALLNEIPKNRVINYRLDQPYNTYLDMRDLTSEISSYTAPLIAPLGPKILTAIGVLIAIEFNEQIPIWRVSSEFEEHPIDRKASGHCINLSVVI